MKTIIFSLITLLWAFSAAFENLMLPEIDMVAVEGGSFTMGLDETETDHAYETPPHKVRLSNYKIGRYEVTQELWEAVMGENPSIFKGDKMPVENASWDDVQLFIKKLNKLTGKRYRLPTEAEWEFAARGGNASKGYGFIGGNDVDETAWHFHNSDRQPHDVGMLKPNELGIYDMGGNVSEWVQDWYGHYPSHPSADPQGAKSSKVGKIFRGGNYINLALYNNPGCRFVSSPQFKSPSMGFRLAE